MRAWPAPPVPSLPGRGPIPVLTHADGTLRPSVSQEHAAAGRAALYVCGITPYDSTHIGHAATYLAFDLLLRAWRDAGLQTTFAECVTDVDDPLLERAAQTGEPWQHLANREIERFRGDMAALRVLPPNRWLGVVEMVPDIVAAVAALEKRGWAYRVPVEAADAGSPAGGNTADAVPPAIGDGSPAAPRTDVYADLSQDPDFGSVAELDAAAMARAFAEHGGDPDRAGKRDPLDPLLWRAERPGEPAWDSPLGRGRPGWHIECGVIASQVLGVPFDVQGGGADLVFPHHEMSTSHLRGLTGVAAPIGVQAHVGLISYEGEKMSKSLGNLVFVSDLLDRGTDPSAIRLALMAEPYGAESDWTDQRLRAAEARLARWRDGIGPGPAPVSAGIGLPGTKPSDAELDVLAEVRDAIGHDLDTPRALQALDRWAAGGYPSALLASAADALLGVRLASDVER
ncbi:MAG: class I tRNA ligase family protein [Bifidobacteriaceae bacterium]|jgi:L-cysteine:1D-myo-inositol 2-amino-2-deoxy-alpha-D-glucopyranoside ligase|nr:class I tRNA ligase family protein [Bifidobacteriaceae bacterium]